MRRFQLVLWVVALPLCIVCLALSGCKKAADDDGGDEGGGGGGGGGKKAAAVKMTEIPMGAGVIKGKVVLKGSKPNVDELTASLQKRIREKDDRDYCLAGSETEKSQQRYRLGTNGNVGNVFVWVMPPDSNTYFKFSKDDLDKLKLKPVEIGQPRCAFEPHAALAFQKYRDPSNPRKFLPTEQTLTVVNNATISHNTKPDGSPKQSLPSNTLLTGMKEGKITGTMEMTLVPDTQPVRIECSIHPWMDGYIWPLDHPYAAITKSDTNPKETKVAPDDPAFGTYEIRNVPTGVKLKIVAWHEEANFLTPDRKMTGAFDIEVPAGGTVEKDFELEVR
jgi:hypothetical protein